jgi:hypothetical protein
VAVKLRSKLFSVVGLKWAAPWSMVSFYLEDLKASGGGKKAMVL